MALLIILLIIFIILFFLWFKFVKIFKLNNINFFKGEIGVGKSQTSIRFGIGCLSSKLFWQNRRRLFLFYLIHFRFINYDKFITNWRSYRKHNVFVYKTSFKRIYVKLFKILSEEDIAIYCDIPLDLRPCHIKSFNLIDSLKNDKRIFKKIECSYPLLKEHLLRQIRFNFKSIIVIDEMSLLIDQSDWKDDLVNNSLNNFFKNIRHETHGGVVIINSQSINDLHYSVKNCLSRVLHIYKRKNLIFGSLLYVQELPYSNDNSIINVNQGDLDEFSKLKVMWVSKKYFKCYDSYAHSWLTDSLKTKNISYDIDKKGKKSWFLWTFKLCNDIFDYVPVSKLSKEQKEYFRIKKIYEKSYRLKKYKEFEKIEKEVINNESKKIS